MSTRLNQIFSKLKTAIEEIKVNGDNKNGKIDTLKEKNKVTELLAGAQQEVGDFFNAEQTKLDNQKLTHAQYKEKDQELSDQRYTAEKKLDAVKTAMINDSPTYHEYDEKNNSFKNIDGLKHIYKDGGYDVIQNSFNDGSYSAETYDKDGIAKGVRLYKNDKVLYTDMNFVAKQLGLNPGPKNQSTIEKAGKFVWDIVTYLLSTEEGALIDWQVAKLKENQFYTVNSDLTLAIYEWNSDKNEFVKI